MYAAAGGASIASRKARQNKALIKGGQKKPPVKGKKTPKVEKPQSKQFHHLPDNYHKGPDPQSSGGLAPPNASLHHSRSLTLRGGENDPSGLRSSRSAHELPSDPALQGLEPGVVGPHDHHPHHSVGSPPRAYTCPHWEAKLLKTPGDRIVAFGSADVPYAVCECAQGKAAWQEAAAGAGAGARRCSVAADGSSGGHRTKQTEAHLRWMKRNRIHDLSYGGSSSDEEEGGFRARVGNAIGGLLYVGLGIVALGLVISFVGTGDKGFKTPELRWTGPALICVGLACCIFRILLCACPRRCRRPRPRPPKEPAAERLLLASCSPPPPPRRLSIAGAALLLQRDSDSPPPASRPPRQPPRPQPPPAPPPERSPAPSPSPSPPGPLLPLVLLSQPRPQPQPQAQRRPRGDDSLIELQTMDGSSFDISSISSSEMSVDNLTVIETQPDGERTCKLNRAREPAHAKRASNPGTSIPRTVTFADTPNVIAPPSEAPPPAAEIVLTPSNLAR